jgi:predicted permease
MIEIFLRILTHNILPVFIVVAAGWVGAHVFKMDVKGLSQASVNIFLPCLIFSTLATAKIDFNQSGRMALFCLLTVLLAGAITWAAARGLRLSSSATAGLMLVVMFTNVGNFGLPVVSFAFGPEALAQATVYMVSMNILLYTLGVAMISGGGLNLGDTALRLVKMPIMHSVVFAALALGLRIAIPEPVMQAVNVLGQGALPAMLIVLGMQLYYSKWTQTPLTWLAVGLRLVVIPLAMLPISASMGFTLTARQAGMLEAATPTGVATTLLAMEHCVEPEFVNNVVFLSTLMSAFSLTPLIFFLRIV